MHSKSLLCISAVLMVAAAENAASASPLVAGALINPAAEGNPAIERVHYYGYGRGYYGRGYYGGGYGRGYYGPRYYGGYGRGYHGGYGRGYYGGYRYY